MNKSVQVQPEEKAVVQINSPDNLLALAIEKGASIDQLERLMDLKERHDAAEAKKAFYAAMSRFQSLVPTIEKTSNVTFNTQKGPTSYNFAPLGEIAEKIKGPLQSCGLSYRFEQKDEGGIQITCIVTHELGHSEKTTMKAGPDQSGNKNAIQAICSAVQYLRRYTLTSALGITTAEQDNDAQTVEPLKKPPYPTESFNKMMPEWQGRIASGKNSPGAIITQISAQYNLSQDQQKRINDLAKKGAA